MTVIKHQSDYQKIRKSAGVLKLAFKWLEDHVQEGLSTEDLDSEVEKIIYDNGAVPAFKGYRGYPASICASVNEVVVHGIPSKNIVLKEGDIVSIDAGVYKEGFFTDAARTYPVGKISREAQMLIDATSKSLEEGINKAVSSCRLYDISHAIESAVKKAGYKEVRAFVGHGIGKALHEPPEVPNWGTKGSGIFLEDGLLLAIEPMVNQGAREIEIKDDGWTAVTKDGKLSAHFEETVIVGDKKAEILT